MANIKVATLEELLARKRAAAAASGSGSASKLARIETADSVEQESKVNSPGKQLEGVSASKKQGASKSTAESATATSDVGSVKEGSAAAEHADEAEADVGAQDIRKVSSPC